VSTCSVRRADILTDKLSAAKFLAKERLEKTSACSQDSYDVQSENTKPEMATGPGAIVDSTSIVHF